MEGLTYDIEDAALGSKQVSSTSAAHGGSRRKKWSKKPTSAALEGL